MVHGNRDNRQLPPSDIEHMKDEITKIKEAKSDKLSDVFRPKIPTCNDFYLEKHHSLSYMSNAFVRNSGMTKDGREFKFPYVKRLNCTTEALSDEFVKEFIDLVDEVITEKHVKLVFQMVMGGGAYEENGKEGITSIPHRDNVIGIVFDIFYDEHGEDLAKKLHDKFGTLLPIFSGKDNNGEVKDIRMTWGSFGDIDMKTEYKKYYGNSELYGRLQELKKRLDPKDVFHTPFTVQLPPSPAHYPASADVSGSDAQGPSAKRLKKTKPDVP